MSVSYCVDGGEQVFVRIFGTGVLDMPTAIIGTFVPGGFVIASDGLSSRPGTLETNKTDAQKIFPIKYPRRVLAFALMGNPEIVEDADHSNVVVNIPDELLNQAEAFHARRSKNLTGFVTRMCTPINRQLLEAMANKKIREYPVARNFAHEEGETICRLLFMGYFDDIPSQVNVRFFHIGGKLQEPWIVAKDPREDYQYGSDKVAAMVMDGDPYFIKYKVKADRSRPLQTSIEIAKNLIDAWGDPRASEIDPDNCRTIGGQTQVYTVTPDAVRKVWPAIV